VTWLTPQRKHRVRANAKEEIVPLFGLPPERVVPVIAVRRNSFRRPARSSQSAGDTDGVRREFSHRHTTPCPN